MSEHGQVVIIGAGHAGGELAIQLRRRSFAGEIALLGEEAIAPYQRPPLSKKFLSGEWDEDRLTLRPASGYTSTGTKLLLEQRALGIDRAARTVQLDGGQTLPYDALVLATGSRPRLLPIPGQSLPGVFTLRSVADVYALRPHVREGAKLVVIGAGYIGLEVAAIARTKGLEVTVVEAEARPLSRVTGPEVATFLLGEHIARGVQFSFGARTTAIEGDSSVRSVRLQNGESIPADIVLIGAGIVPNTTLAELAELDVQDGIVTDSLTQTSDPRIFAIGDCARRPCKFYDGRMVRGESVHNAVEGARIAAAAIAGAAPPAEELPWNWSDQYDLKLTSAGLCTGYDATVLRGQTQDRAFALFYYRAGQLIAVDAVNRPEEYLGVKMALQRGLNLPAEHVADTSRTLKELIAEAGSAKK